MLVLKRKIGEEIIINGDTLVTVLSMRGGVVSIGIDAPDDVDVDRTEVHRRKHGCERVAKDAAE